MLKRALLSLKLPDFKRSGGSGRKAVFVHSESTFHGLTDKTDFVLSPAFYWCRREELGKQSLYRARKLAPSVFHGLLPQGENFRYKVTRQGDSFLFFAYNEGEILARLEALGIPRELVGRLYFAQSELFPLEEPLRVTPESVLIEQNGLLAMVPASLLPDAPLLDPPARLTGLQHPVRLSLALPKKSGGGYPSASRPLWLATVLVALFLLAEGSRYVRLSTALENLQDARSTLYTRAGLPATSFQVEAMRSRLEKIDRIQQSLRLTLSPVSLLQHPDYRLETLTLNNDTVEARFAIKDKRGIAPLKKVLETAMPGASLSETPEQLTARSAL